MSGTGETLAVYGRMAAEYDAVITEQGEDPALAALLEAMPDGGRVLDLGCGPGVAAATLIAKGFSVDAVDGSDQMIARARDRGVPARRMTFAEMTLQGPYDGVLASFSLLHVPRSEMPGHLASLHAALRPGGTLVLAMKTGTGERRDRLGRFYSFYTEDELRRLLTDVGFRITSTVAGVGRGLAGTLDPWIVLSAHA